MSNKKRKAKKKFQAKSKPKSRHVISSQQNARLQQAMQAQSSGNTGFAEAEYRSLIAEKAITRHLYHNLALICLNSSRRDEAIIYWKKALSIDPRFIEAGMSLADVYQQSGNLEQAERYYRRIVSDHNDAVDAKYLLGNILKSRGKFDQAKAYDQEIMTQQVGYTQAHFTYSRMHKYQDRSDPHISLMLELNQNPNLKHDNKIHLAFSLAKAFEDLQDYAQAFEYLKLGNSLRYKEFNYTIDGDEKLIQSIIRAFSQEAMAQIKIKPCTTKRPIFILGMPRSGTSLVEKIVASHSEVHAAGELDYIFDLGVRFFLQESADYQFRSLDTYSGEAFEQFGQTYIEKLALLNSKARQITDKMPLNMMMIGLIKLALPNAKIVHCVRDPKDNCLSIFKQNFTTGNYRFAYDLKTVAQFHNQYQSLMAHWHRVMPGEIYDMNYEALTQNPEVEIRKLLAACDLEWQEDCLNFNKSAGLVDTASFYQVRQPMYTSSVMLWEKFQEFLGPMLEELDQI